MIGRSKNREASGLRPLERRFRTDKTLRTADRIGARKKRIPQARDAAVQTLCGHRTLLSQFDF
jgi:hypothetical protein